MIRANDMILFQGDSITDFGRVGSPGGLGTGYVGVIQGLVQARHGKLKLRIVNRGVGGDRTAELLARWQKDCLDLKPDVLSIMIGVNDVWRKKGEWNGQKHIPLPQFTDNCVRLLDQAVASGIKRLVLMSPTTIDQENEGELNQLLHQYTDTVKALAAKYKAVYVPSHEAMLAARAAAPEVTWTGDGCHPTTPGHALLADCWLKAVGL